MSLPEQAKREFINRLLQAANILAEYGCSRQEIYSFCLTRAANLLMEICQHYNPPINPASLVFGEQILATCLGEVISHFPREK